MTTPRIILDAMGGDHAPRIEVEGALLALKESKGSIEIVLVGVQDIIEAQILATTGGPAPKGISIVHAPQVIEMKDIPTVAMRTKRQSSIVIGLEMLKRGEGTAFVSAGNTGAVLAASMLILGKLEGVSRPTIGAYFPTERGVSLLVDAGANIDTKPRHLLEFGIMGSIYYADMIGVERPTIGLLSIGEESIKGDERTLEAHHLFAQSHLNFTGNIEGRDILIGKADVVVCDGFVGNILVKFGESVLSVLKNRIREISYKNLFRKITMALAYGTLRLAFRSFDYQEHGGVPLLGVKGVSIIGHGASSAKAMKNMILNAQAVAEKKIPERIQKALSVSKPQSE